MSFRVRNVTREFTPSEAAAITGVSVDLQRDWRRRKILPEKLTPSWTKFQLTDIIQMLVMKSFSDAGFSVKEICDAAAIAVLPTLKFLESVPGSIAIEGGTVPDVLKDRIFNDGFTVGANGRYLVMTSRGLLGRLGSLNNLEAYLEELDSAQCTILDCSKLANIIASKADLPLVRVEVTEQLEGDAS